MASSSLMRELLSVVSVIPKLVHSVAVHLPEEAIAELDEWHGLVGFLRRYPLQFRIQKDSSGIFTVAHGNTMLPQETDLVEWLKCLVPMDEYVSVSSIISQLDEKQRSILKFFGNMSVFLGSLIDTFRLSLDKQHVVQKDEARNAPQFGPDIDLLRREEDRFAFAACADDAFGPDSVPFGHLPPAPPPVASTFHSLADPNEVVEYDPATKRVLEEVVKVLPSFFIPFSSLEAGIPADTVRQGNLFSVLERVSGRDLDIRVLGDQKSDIYIRLVGANLPTGKHEIGNIHFKEFAVLPLAKGLHAALAQRRGEWVSIDELPSVLPPDLLAALPLKEAASILVFDRLQHLFDVDTENYRVRARDPRAALDFNFSRTPCPQSVRFVLQVTREPTPLAYAQSHIPPLILSELSSIFPSFVGFVGAHRLYMFLRDDRLLTSRLMRSRMMRSFPPRGAPRGRYQRSIPSYQGPVASAAEVRNAILRRLPEDGPIGWQRLSRMLPPKVVATIPLRAAFGFLSRFTEFRCYEIHHSRQWVIQHAHLPPPSNVARRISSMEELHQQLIDVTAPFNGTQFASYVALNQRLTHQVKEILRQKGFFSVMQYLERHPNDFQIHRVPGATLNNSVIFCSARPSFAARGLGASLPGRPRGGSSFRGRGRPLRGPRGRLTSHY